ncbi:MAG: PQQ-dependent sugar dehydrogenase [Burkholderiales bacterium]|jgi:glucose/arabinose dehydrogenase|nr:PQQ-dependent sugar dehydrogenase [Burkholderiales bacterium]
MRRRSFCPARFNRLSVALALAAAATVAQAGPLRLETVGTGFDQPLFVTAPTGGSTTIHIVEKGGTIIALDRATGTRSTFLDIGAKVDTDGERGLLGLAFSPNWATDRHVYVNYIDATTKNTIVSRFTANAAGTAIDATSELRVLSVAQPPGLDNHKAGWIGFKPGDARHLYIATGDGGGGNDPLQAGQDLTTPLGKVLRVDVTRDGFAADPDRNYAIPDDNPFVGNAAALPELWAYGLRNPFRASFDRQTGDLWIGDVGQDAREEVNFEAAASPGGINWGWSVREGTEPTPGVGADPLYEYAHTAQERGSITGGYVYRGPIAELQGQYFFGDFVRGTIGSLVVDGTGVTFIDRTASLALPAGIGRFQIASFGEDAFGNLYVVGIDGRVFALVPEPSTWLALGAGLFAMLLAQRRRVMAVTARAGT